MTPPTCKEKQTFYVLIKTCLSTNCSNTNMMQFFDVLKAKQSDQMGRFVAKRATK